MSNTFNLGDFTDRENQRKSRYERRIHHLQSIGQHTSNIEETVGRAAETVDNGVKSFVIYGEPQSGKTEMMIALTAKLLDKGHRIIIILMNDSVQLLEQNLDRFLRSGLDPAPKKFNEILDPSIDIHASNWVIFCKKNSADLQKLLIKLEGSVRRVVIDDEADYATPNSKINKQEQTKINELIGSLLEGDGVYIGVTATPARLDLNNTFGNQNRDWIDFQPHPEYCGQEKFFPTTSKGFDLEYVLVLLPDEGDDPKYLRSAFFRFLTNVAFLNTQINDQPINYCMLIHTSGKKVDHTKDFIQVTNLLTSLKDSTHEKFEKHAKEIFQTASELYPGHQSELTGYIIDHIAQSDVVVMNSDTERNAAQYRRATSPATLFTVAIGGNIVSRGVTFDNLLSMFFTRDVKHKIQQDTYIQRARMFGSRGGYLKYFELHIPESLYIDWQRCFVFHRLALSFIREGRGSLLWLEDKRIAVVAASSIDNAAVAITSGEMSWGVFNYSEAIDDEVNRDNVEPQEHLESLAAIVGDDAFPSQVLDFIKGLSFGRNSVALHKTRTAYGTDEEQREIRRTRGFLGTNQLELKRFPHAMHHVEIFKNDQGRARVFYKYTPENGGTIRFLKNYGRQQS